MARQTSLGRGEQSSSWHGALADALNDLDIIGGEISWRVSDLYTHQCVTGRQRRALINLATKAQRVLDDLARIRQVMGLPERPDGN